MSEPTHRSPLHAYVHTRFREVFGAPSNSLGKDDHWALQTVTTEKPINVLVNGTPSMPAVWVFDPHHPLSQVYSAALANERQVDEVITLIKKRVDDAGQPPATDSNP